ncbi:MAG: hypothetical protein M1832_004943 [Thelocarpon impressellum]|nr:MAG: hypothetical protein M1832_004943 [Thelocarpon impressellum]
MSSKEWPGLLERLLERLDHIAREDFPTPQIPLRPAAVPATNHHFARPQAGATAGQDESSQSSQSANKENAPPQSPARPPVPPFSSAASEQTTTESPTVPPTLTPAEGTLPPPLLAILTSIRATLTANFSLAPPHTVQRLAELVLRPRAHYRSLLSYLRALDRVVSVSSSADIFPLPAASLPDASEAGLLNGTSGIISGGVSAGGLGSDESLGGALLTPIPWLRNEQQSEVRTESTEKVDGPNGLGSVETVSVSVRGVPSTSQPPPREPMREAGGVTQGELLRQEQEAGVVPVAQTTGRQTRSATARGLAESSGGKAEEEEHPHARGPEEVGMEDMGPQERPGAKTGFDVEAALGRSMPHKADERDTVTPAKEAAERSDQASSGAQEPAQDKAEAPEAQEDVVLADADGKAEAAAEAEASSSADDVGDVDVDVDAGEGKTT